MLVPTLFSPETVAMAGNDDVIFSNFTYNPNTYYFLYVGDLKNYSLNHFVRETLARRLSRQDIQFIAIVPDVCIQYNYANIIVINPVATEDMVKNHTFSDMDCPPRMGCRLKSSTFMKAVSESSNVRNLIEAILETRTSFTSISTKVSAK